MKRVSLTAAFLLSLAACNKPAEENVVTIDNDAATPTSTEVLPPDESVDMPNAETANAENAATEAGIAANNSSGNRP
jgi:hypothetical protein